MSHSLGFLCAAWVLSAILFSYSVVVFLTGKCPSVHKSTTATGKPTFTIDWDKDMFLKDGKEYRFAAGTVHYWRIPRELWSDRLNKMRLAGLNAVHVSVPWFLHEEEPGSFNFSGRLDLQKFIHLAHSQILHTILNVGPYIGAQVDNGGLPYWLLREFPDIRVRTSDTNFMYFVGRWMKRLGKIVRENTYEVGGAVILVQIENLYGRFAEGACDKIYLKKLKSLLREELGNRTVVFTVGDADFDQLQCGATKGALTTVKLTPTSDVDNSISTIVRNRFILPHGPLVCGAYVIEQPEYWQHNATLISPNIAADTLDRILQFNASVVITGFTGGTNFGTTGGAVMNGSDFLSFVTSYGPHAPVQDDGDISSLFEPFSTILRKHFPGSPGPLPLPVPKGNLGPVSVSKTYGLLDNLELFCPDGPRLAAHPLSFEELGVRDELVVYRTVAPVDVLNGTLLIEGMRDHGMIFVDQVYAGTISRSLNLWSVVLSINKGQTLDLLVESHGRLLDSSGDPKGILGPVLLDDARFGQWQMYNIPLNGSVFHAIKQLRVAKWPEFGAVAASLEPAVYSAKFSISPDHALDTYLSMEGWGKGYVFLNGINLGRYWTVGPYVTLYIPKSLWSTEAPNNVTVLELEKAPCSTSEQCTITFVDSRT